MFTNDAGKGWNRYLWHLVAIGCQTEIPVVDMLCDIFTYKLYVDIYIYSIMIIQSRRVVLETAAEVLGPAMVVAQIGGCPS